MSYDEDPDETIYFKEINPCGILCEGKHPVLPLTVLATGFMAEGRIKMPGSILQEWGGNYLQRIQIWPSKLQRIT